MCASVTHTLALEILSVVTGQRTTKSSSTLIVCVKNVHIYVNPNSSVLRVKTSERKIRRNDVIVTQQLQPTNSQDNFEFGFLLNLKK